MRRTRAERRDTNFRKRWQRYNQLRKQNGYHGSSDSEMWRRAKSDQAFPRWANDPDEFEDSLRLLVTDSARADFGAWYYSKAATIGCWSEKDLKSFQEAKQIVKGNGT